MNNREQVVDRHRGVERRGPSDRPRLRQTRSQSRTDRPRQTRVRGDRERGPRARRASPRAPRRCRPTPIEVEAAATQMEERFGPIDIWVNDAMATIFAPFTEISAEEYQRATEVTYLGTVYGTMAALRRMKPRDHGTVVQVGSALAYRAIPLQSAYCGAKFAIRGFTDSVRTELMHEQSKVWITMVQLPAVNTPQFNWCRTKLPNHPQPVPPIYEPEVPAEAIYWAAHHRRREITVGGSAVKAIVGDKIAPGLADRYLAKTGYESQQIPNHPVRRAPRQPVRTGGRPCRHPRHLRSTSPSAVACSCRLTTHRRMLAAVGAAGIGALATALVRGR